MYSTLKKASSLALLALLSLDISNAQNLNDQEGEVVATLLKDYESSGDTNLLNIILGIGYDFTGKTDEDLVADYEARSAELAEMIAIAKTDGPSAGFTLPTIPSTCAEQTFGYGVTVGTVPPKQSFYETAICDTIAKFADICTAESDGICSVSSSIVADVSVYFQDSDLLAYFYCLDTNGLNPASCSDYSTVTGAYTGVFDLSSYDAVLLTDFIGQGTYDEDAVYFGNGALYLNTYSLDEYFASGKTLDANWEPFNIKFAALDAMTSSYVTDAYANGNTDATLLELYNIFLKAYFVEKYGKFSDGFVKGAMKNNSIRFTRFSGELDGFPCAYAMGVLATAFCGFDAVDIFDWADYYLTNFPSKCTDSALVNDVYPKAKVTLQMTRPYSRAKRTPAACANRLGL